MSRRNTSTVRIHKDLEFQIKQMSRKNNIKMVDASKNLAKMLRKMNGKTKLIKEIKF